MKITRMDRPDDTFRNFNTLFILSSSGILIRNGKASNILIKESHPDGNFQEFLSDTAFKYKLFTNELQEPT